MTVTKLALLGVGDVAQRDYLPEFHRLHGRAELVAACGRTSERVAEVASRYRIPSVYTDYGHMLAETDADAVINLTPIQLHHETTLACLEAGKHVYTEKPVASTVSDAAELAQLASERDLVLVCAPSVVLFPQVRRAQALLDEGHLGAVHTARAQALMGVPPWPGFTSDPTPYFAEGAGPALDMGVYPLHILTALLGPVRRVAAMVGQAMTGFTVDDGPLAGRRVPVEVPDNWHLLLDFGGQTFATLTANSCVQDSRAPWVEVYGLEGTVALHPFDVSAPVELMRTGEDWQELDVRTPGARQIGPDHHLGIEHLVDCIQDGRSPTLSVDHAIHVLEVIEQAAESARLGRAFDLSSRF